MSAKKTGRKKKSAYKLYKKQLNAVIAVKEAMAMCQQVIGAAQMQAMRSAIVSKCTRCKHSYDENIGGVVISPRTKEVV